MRVRARRLAVALVALVACGAARARADGWVSAFSELRPAPGDLSDARLSLAERVALARALGAFGPEPEAVAALLAGLAADPPPLVRDEILRSIARRAPPQAAGPIAARLAAEQAALPALCMALAAIGTPAAVQALVGALAREDAAPVAERALVRAGAAAVEPLVAALAGPSAERAAKVLGEIGEPAAGAGSALIAALGARDPRVRAASARALGQIGERAAAAQLLRRSDERAPEVAQAALVALSHVAGPAQANALAAQLERAPVAQRPLVLRALAAADPARAVQAIAQALGGDEPRMREAALGLIEGERPDPSWLPALERVFATELREASASALARLPEGAGVAALVRVGMRAPESADRAARALALALRSFDDDLPGDQRDDALALIRSQPPERRLLLSALARDPDALGPIAAGLRSARAGERARAAAAAALLGEPDAVPALLSALARERDPEAARRIASAAAALGASAPLPTLWRLLGDPATAPEAMLLAARSTPAGELPDRALRVRLRRALASRGPSRVRSAAALALGALGDRAALTPLSAALADPATRVRLAAVRALGALGGAEAARACAAHARVERDALVRRAAREVADRDGRPAEIAERGELVLEVRVIGLRERERVGPLIDVLLEDGRWLRMRADAEGELIVADLPAGSAELRRVE